MFTGLVEERGLIVGWADDGPAARRISIECSIVLDDIQLGSSVAINGCCLTVVDVNDNVLDFQAGTETLSRTNLGELNSGDCVNLERAVQAGDRLGGHFVSGHIDCVGTILQRKDSSDWSTFWVKVPKEITKQMASKGSVTIDGVSLTLVDVDTEKFSVALIPHTLGLTTLGDSSLDDSVNIETDILAKYVQQQLIRQDN